MFSAFFLRLPPGCTAKEESKDAQLKAMVDIIYIGIKLPHCTNATAILRRLDRACK